MEIVGEDDLLVRLAVVVGVLVDQDLVVGLVVTRAEVRVARHHGDPQATLVVEGKLDRIGEVRELLLRGEHLDLVAFGHGQGLLRVLAILVFGAAVLVARLVVGFDFGKLRRRIVGRLEIEAAAVGDRPYRAVAVFSKRAHFRGFGRVVLRAEGVKAAAVDVDAVEHFVVVEPEPILVAHGLDHRGRLALGLALGFPESLVDQHRAELLVAFVAGQEAVAGEGFFKPGVELAGGVEEIDELDFPCGGDFTHCFGVKSEVFVLLLAVGEVAFGGEILEGDR